jgi:hypothetical protein
MRLWLRSHHTSSLSSDADRHEAVGGCRPCGYRGNLAVNSGSSMCLVSKVHTDRCSAGCGAGGNPRSTTSPTRRAKRRTYSSEGCMSCSTLLHLGSHIDRERILGMWMRRSTIDYATISIWICPGLCYRRRGLGQVHSWRYYVSATGSWNVANPPVILRATNNIQSRLWCKCVNTLWVFG